MYCLVYGQNVLEQNVSALKGIRTKGSAQSIYVTEPIGDNAERNQNVQEENQLSGTVKCRGGHY
jgi:hypothetical protein